MTLHILNWLHTDSCIMAQTGNHEHSRSHLHFIDEDLRDLHRRQVRLREIPIIRQACAIVQRLRPLSFNSSAYCSYTSIFTLLFA